MYLDGFQIKHHEYLLSLSSIQSIDLNPVGDAFINQHSHEAYHLIEKKKNIRWDCKTGTTFCKRKDHFQLKAVGKDSLHELLLRCILKIGLSSPCKSFL